MTNWIKATGEMAEGWNTDKNENFKKGATLHGVITERRSVTTQYGDRKIFTIEEAKTNKKWGLWMTAQLEAIMGHLPVNTELKVTYLGKEKTPKGQMAHKFEVEYDQDTVDVALSAKEIFSGQ